MSSDLRADEAGPATAPEVIAEDEPPGHSARPAFIVFVGAEIAGLVMYLVMGRAMWFYGDEWNVLSSRGLPDMFRQNGGHLIALPFAVYRLLFFFFGLRTYMPYLLMTVGLHLAVAALLRAIMRRAGVGPWVATAAASLYVFFGSGSQNTLWAFQITFVGAVAFGLLQLLLADHDGPLDRRDWLGLGCGLLAIACSGVAVTMIAVVGVAGLIRGRWRAALFHTVPLGLVWVFWSVRYAATPRYVTKPRVLFDWDSRGLGAAFRSLGYVAPVGWALAAILIAGLVLVLKQWEPEQRARLAVPLAMLVGAFLFLTITGTSRAAFGLQAAASSRYLDVVAVLLLPALAVAADALARRRRVLLPVVLALLVVGIPGNIAAVRRQLPPARYFRAYRQMMLSLPRMSLATRVPGSLHPEPNQAPRVTVSWLLDTLHSGRLGHTRAPTAGERGANIVRLSLDQSSSAPGSSCRTIDKPVLLHLRAGDAFTIEGRVAIRLVRDRVRSDPVVFGAGFLTGAGPHELVDVGGPLALRLSKPRPDIEGSVCKSRSDSR